MTLFAWIRGLTGGTLGAGLAGMYDYDSECDPVDPYENDLDNWETEQVFQDNEGAEPEEEPGDPDCGDCNAEGRCCDRHFEGYCDGKAAARTTDYGWRDE